MVETSAPRIVWEKGGSVLWCGDCAEVVPGLPPADHVISDPPFTQRTSDNARSHKGRNLGHNVLNGGAAFIGFAGVDGQEAEISRMCLAAASRWVVLFCALEQLGAYSEAAGPAWIRGTVWRRTNSAPQFTGDRPGQACEGIAIMHRKGRKRWNRGGDCLYFSGATANSPGEEDGKNGHPTPKPLWLMLEILEAFTEPGDLILDPYTGSGTTGVACLRLGRRFIGVERDEKYAAIAAERLEAESKGLSLRDARAGQIALFSGGT